MNVSSWIDRFVLLLLMAASAGLFWWRFRIVLAVSHDSRATPDFHLKPVGWRIRKFLWEVALQAKVIAQRPLAGVAHAFVFWGFCAFGPITINHLASAFGGRFLALDRGFGRFYFTFVAF